MEHPGPEQVVDREPRIFRNNRSRVNRATRGLGRDFHHLTIVTDRGVLSFQSVAEVDARDGLAVGLHDRSTHFLQLGPAVPHRGHAEHNANDRAQYSRSSAIQLSKADASTQLTRTRQVSHLSIRRYTQRGDLRQDGIAHVPGALKGSSVSHYAASSVLVGSNPVR